jgi:hypothetical protein
MNFCKRKMMVLLLAALCGLACGSLAVTAFVLLCGAAWDRDVEQRTSGGRARCEATSQTMKEALDDLAAKIQAVQQRPPPEAAPVLPRRGLSPARRTQALRLHRRGEPPQQIAAALEIPLTEVDLLLKAHRIVMSNV